MFIVINVRLDVREESGRLNMALGEVLRALDLADDFPAMRVDKRLELLTGLLVEPLPGLSRHPGVTPEAEETWSVFQLIKRAGDVYGRELVGPFVISMCRSECDVLTVLLLARWKGCDQGMQIVPLFETIEDLQAAPSILEKLYTLPVYRQHLTTCGNAQIVMIGYSDSNKDGGYVTANWSLYQGQARPVARLHEGWRLPARASAATFPRSSRSSSTCWRVSRSTTARRWPSSSRRWVT